MGTMSDIVEYNIGEYIYCVVNVAHTSQAVTLYIIYSVTLPIQRFLLVSAPRQVN